MASLPHGAPDNINLPRPCGVPELFACCAHGFPPFLPYRLFQAFHANLLDLHQGVAGFVQHSWLLHMMARSLPARTSFGSPSQYGQRGLTS
jgi:hypothetical protein